MARILLSILLMHLSGTLIMCNAADPPKFPAILVFGDSTVDSGNNNYITTVFKSNHYPYGVQFINGTATGRFSDGRLVPDMLASSLGIKQQVPPFLDPSLSDNEIVTGVCFASAGSGLDDLTTRVSRVIPVSRQLEMFRQYISRLQGIVGEQEASKIINNGLILMSVGTNDFLFNFYDIPTRRSVFNYTISGYQDFLLQRLQGMIKEIHQLGGRKFGIAGLAPIGCIPLQISAKFRGQSNRTCVDDQNSDAVVYNSKLQKVLPELQASLPGSILAYIDLHDPAVDLFTNRQKYGFVEVMKGCCGTGLMEMGPLCNKWTSQCTDRSKYLFWDAVHPSEAAYRPIAKNILETVIPQLY
ncbi:hypothetical protein MRB53_003875 [Persea americana]|uniref:Uncharacterized protein n=1 Tax=Persea americana TaxID=3435 RepID=A0ACC2N244_PERAE|nr:hypothetical protein MRB53_003875 [Persea americana]